MEFELYTEKPTYGIHGDCMKIFIERHHNDHLGKLS